MRRRVPSKRPAPWAISLHIPLPPSPCSRCPEVPASLSSRNSDTVPCTCYLPGTQRRLEPRPVPALTELTVFLIGGDCLELSPEFWGHIRTERKAFLDPKSQPP